MAAETEVLIFGNKTDSDMSSNRDLVKPDCSVIKHGDQANGSYNSCVFVAVVDGTVNNEENMAVLESSSVEIEAAVDVKNGNLDFANGEVNGNVEADFPVENGILKELERFHADRQGIETDVADSVRVDPNGKTECEAGCEIQQVEGSNGKLDSSAGAEIVMVGEQEGYFEGVEKSEVDKVDDLIVAKSEPASVENAETEVGGLGLVEESVELGELNNLSSHSESDNENHQCENQTDLISTETSGVSQGSPRLSVNAVGDELKEVITEVHNGAVVEDAVHEAPLATSLDYPGSYSINNKEESLEEKEKLNNVSTHKNDSDNATDESEDQINLGSTQTFGAGQGSSNLVVDAVEFGLQGATTEGQKKAKLEGEVVASQELELPVVTSADSDLKSCAINKGEKPEEKGDSNTLFSHSESNNTSDESEDKIVAHSTQTPELLEGFPQVVVDAFECGSLECDIEEQNEAKFGEVVECEVPTATPLDSDLQLYPMNNEEGTLEKVAKMTAASDVMEYLKGNTAPSNNVELEQVGKVINLVSSSDRRVETVCDSVSVEKNKECTLVSNVVDSVQHPEEHPDVHEKSSISDQSEVDSDDSLPTLSLPDSHVNDSRSEIAMFGAETFELGSSSPINSPKPQITENGPSGHTTNNVSLGSDSMLGPEVCTEKESTFQGDDKQVEAEISSGKGEVLPISTETGSVELNPAETRTSSTTSKDTTTNVTVTFRKELLDCFRLNKEAASNIMWGTSNIRFGTTDVEDMGDQLDDATESSDEKLLFEEDEDTGESKNGSISITSPEGSSTDDVSEEDPSIKFVTRPTDEVSEEDPSIKAVTKPTDEVSEENPSITAVTQPLNYLVRIPRSDDGSLKERINLQKRLVDEHTKLKDDIQVQIQETRRSNNKSHGVNHEYAKHEVSSARKLVRSKRMEIDSLQSMINKAKNATSIEDIDRWLCDMERRIQHETMPLKEEKQIIREIKQLKQLREQLSANMGSQDEIKESLEQRETLEERLKILRKELDILKGKILKAEAAAGEAEMKYDDENKKVKELQARYRTANDCRQEAYVQLQSLRKELYEKNKSFYEYKNDATTANNYAHSRDSEAFQLKCTDQVEKFMELWNNNDKLREEYVTLNARSTIRRLGTLDGRSLGPKEERPVLPNYIDQRVHKMVSTPAKVDSVSRSPILDPKREINSENGTSEVKIKEKVTQNKNQPTKTKGTAEPVLVNGSATVSDRDVPEAILEESEKSMEEIELARKAEEIRRKEAEAQLKEQFRLEELAKANEARERKKRQAEKEKRRAELKAQKEAEQKEKEREKRLRKKEQKKAAVTVTTDSSTNSIQSALSTENAAKSLKEIEAKETSSVKKPPQKPSVFTKQQIKKKLVVPPPLRIQNRRSWKQYVRSAIMRVKQNSRVVIACIFSFILIYVVSIMLSNSNLNISYSG